MISLPATWRRVRLGEVCEINPRLPVDPGLQDRTPVSFVPMASVDETSGEITAHEERPYIDAKKGFTPFVEDDVLFAKITPSMENGKAAIARDLRNGVGFGSTEFHVLRCSDLIRPEFVFHFIRQPAFRDWARSAFVGSAGQQRVPQSFLARVPILLPTVPEQRRIVDILQHSETVHRQRRDVTESLSQLVNLAFLELFRHLLDNRNVPQFRPLGNYIEEARYGTSASLSEEGDIRVLRMNNLTEDGWIDIDDVKFVPADSVDLNVLELTAGDLVFNRTNSRELVGKSAIWFGERDSTSFASYLVRIRFKACDPQDDDCVLPEYVWGLLNSRYGKARLLNMAKQAVSMANISPTQLGEMRIPVPPLELQTQFRSIVDEVRALRASSMDSGPLFDALGQSVVSDAYSGRLTQAWRDARRAELEQWLLEHVERMPRHVVSPPEPAVAPADRTAARRHPRPWLIDQLSALQAQVFDALRGWNGTLMPAEYLDRFLDEPSLDHLEDRHDQVLRALDQLAGLGLVARVSLPNERGEYVSGYRTLREDELSRDDDLERLGAPA